MKKFRLGHFDHGFTLIELLVVVTIISSIAVIFIPRFREFRERQNLESATLDVASLSRQAYVNATTGVLCGDLLNPIYRTRNWHMHLYTNTSTEIGNRNQIVMHAHCRTAGPDGIVGNGDDGLNYIPQETLNLPQNLYFDAVLTDNGDIATAVPCGTDPTHIAYNNISGKLVFEEIGTGLPMPCFTGKTRIVIVLKSLTTTQTSMVFLYDNGQISTNSP